MSDSNSNNINKNDSGFRELQTLNAKKVVAMANGDLETSGPLNGVVTQRGDVATFEKLLEEESMGTVCIVPEVGVATEI